MSVSKNTHRHSYIGEDEDGAGECYLEYESSFPSLYYVNYYLTIYL
jgi:hypothetical protein